MRTRITSPWSAADPSHSCAIQQHPTSSSPVPFPFSESLWSPHGKPQSTGSGASERMPQPSVPWTDSSERCSLHFSSGVPVESSSCCSFLPRHTLTAISLPDTVIRSNRSEGECNLRVLQRTLGTRRNPTEPIHGVRFQFNVKKVLFKWS